TSAIHSTKRNLAYLVHPSSSSANAPIHFRTRAFLKSAHHIAIFIFWRVVRAAKYALIGSLVAAVAGTAVGGVVSGAGFLIAPTGIIGGAAVGLLWGFGK
ncbi:hypothetical protein K402DRAFT_317107, partial [Aulographum hederae CBS 113979]